MSANNVVFVTHKKGGKWFVNHVDADDFHNIDPEIKASSFTKAMREAVKLVDSLEKEGFGVEYGIRVLEDTEGK